MSRHRDPRTREWVDDGPAERDLVAELFDRLAASEAARASERNDLHPALTETGVAYTDIHLDLIRGAAA